ncbi:hypothetical protein TSAR_012348 [Trichomalopsis sarcophagae]|uniref:Uncharacterized protein n=1 Tax=Trichomalopsis sarcophagae TaxID=543379 RepID=A0A232F3X8_9HYME|nr:hypothetical protein TSAR_012348 [Trichomalopsis sarcophagae]
MTRPGHQVIKFLDALINRMQKTALRSNLLFKKSTVKPFSVLYFLDNRDSDRGDGIRIFIKCESCPRNSTGDKRRRLDNGKKLTV